MNADMKYALVTGSSRGIGQAIADTIERNGYVVFRNGRSEVNHPHYIMADLSTLDGVNTLADTVLALAPMLDCVVLNAGMTCRMNLNDMEYSCWQQVMDTNVNMPFFLIQRLFERISSNGSVLFTSSVLSVKPHASSIPYGVSKSAINMLAQCLVKEFAPRNIRVNVICPGFIDTEWQKEKPLWLRKKIESKISLSRFGSPEEVAGACMSVIANSYINGAIIQVDGGYDLE